ncbi:RNA-binding region RNP-1 domain-containing protein [Mucor ambiguus]|uniref:RNA-binding region RNP-1 domain-containing protein n=1 Tax=Mucor ambiguus TaxID=91626 RepID=A0A0C9LWJ8_9FUNG|nr:RNA-binding region RNP-1 domain-containing protein [Mucor ambiguus]
MTTTTVATTIDKPKTIVLDTPQLKEEHKVFIGNLSFKTTKESLISFASTSGKIVDATIITKQRHSLGYGFVTFETEQDAQKAAKDLDSTQLDGRVINAEVARPKAGTFTDAPQKTRKSKSNARRRSKSAVASSPLSSSSPLPSSAKEEDSVVPAEKEEEDGVVPTVEKNNSAAEKKMVVKKEMPVKQEPENDVIAADTETTEELDQEKTPEQIAKEAAARRKRNQKDKKRQNKKKKSAEKAARATAPSKTTLFVANLPYATTDDDLNTIFKDYKLVSAHVARMNNGCSKGYGFVELESEQEQLKALESVKDVVLEGRSIYLKIALSEQKVPVINAESKVADKMEEKKSVGKDTKKEEIILEHTVADALKVNDTN